MKRTATLQVLDEYAKTLTKKQANMLYEAKMNKKYSKRLYEMAEDEPDELSLYLDSYIIADNELLNDDIIDEIKTLFGHDVKISESSTGLIFYTYDKKTYAKLLAALETIGVPTEDLTDALDPNYLYN